MFSFPNLKTASAYTGAGIKTASTKCPTETKQQLNIDYSIKQSNPETINKRFFNTFTKTEMNNRQNRYRHALHNL
ncbi:MAG: hypothetical protein LBL39_05775 [Planctomycetaceae bacterium]|nr:hypothetical protein [Planctomycetaceae bacterium]